MPKTLKIAPHLDSKELENRYPKAHHPVERSHYQILWLVEQGNTTARVMEGTGYSRGWIQQLACRYNADGPEALGTVVTTTRAPATGRCSTPTNAKSSGRR